MKKKLLLIIVLLAGLQFSTYASHYVGTELNYKIIAPNTYEVTFKTYSECSGVQPPTSVNVLVNAPNCNAGRSIVLNRVSQQVKTLSGPAMPTGCNAAALAHTVISTFSDTLTFSAAEQTCTDWVLSWSECCRADAGNLVNAASFNFYTEAHLKLLPNLVNSSPAFDTINHNVSFAGVNQPILISALAQDPDGDSLVYSSVAPLSAANQPIAYMPIGGASGVIINPNPLPPYNNIPFGQPGSNPQIAFFPPGASGNYSPGFPLSSYTVNWSSPAPNFAQPFFNLDPLTGNIAFQPSVFVPNTNFNNRYALSIQVDEYRKINGVVTKIGSVRRETFIEVVDGNGNRNPYLSQVEMNLSDIELGDIIELRPGTPMHLKLGAVDMDVANTVLMRSNVSAVLPGAVFASNGLSQPSGSISWTPTASDVRQQPYYFNVVLLDDANPLRGYHERTIGVRVRLNGNVTGAKENLVGNTGFSAYPNPFTEALNFKFTLVDKAECIVIYNLLGREIDRVSLSKTGLGEQDIRWENAGKHAAGIYVAKLVSTDKTVQTLKFTKLQ